MNDDAFAPLSHPYDDDKLREECGVFGVFGANDAAALTVLGLHALQHRGQEAAGIVTFDGEHFISERRLGHVADHFTKAGMIDRLKGDSAIGHVRYSTTGETVLRNVQPLFADLASGGFAMAHNGNLTNSARLRDQLVQRGSIFQSTMDSETIVHLVATSMRIRMVDKMVDALRQVEGAYSLVTITNKKLIGVRDPLGVRPLVLGKLGDAHILTSESCALDIVGAEYVREVKPGEMIVITEDGIESLMPFARSGSRFCVFEYIYFARPDSFMEGRSVYEARKRIGEELARESDVPADVVIPVPDSGVPAAIGYAAQSGVPFELGIIRNHYVGRSFIEPTDNIRNFRVKLKHNANRSQVEGKRIILVDDSIVRGTTSIKIVNMMREAGATEVHMRIAAPPTAHSCFYGVDTPERSKLLAAQMTIAEMADHIGVDSLAYISMDGLYKAMGDENGRDDANPTFCDACFTGDYPTTLTDHEHGDSGRQLSLLSTGT
ncbi:MAG: amidophosphoribosyltransferase [Alphaproteobacteria bacterium]